MKLSEDADKDVLWQPYLSKKNEMKFRKYTQPCQKFKKFIFLNVGIYMLAQSR